VVGRSEDGDTLVVRCSVCGERSRVKTATSAAAAHS
jgi:hypothetical protein